MLGESLAGVVERAGPGMTGRDPGRVEGHPATTPRCRAPTNDFAARAPRTFIRAHSAIELPYGVGGQSRFFSASSSRVASTYPTTAAPKQGKPDRIGCSVIASGRHTGTRGGYFRPSRRSARRRVLRDRHRPSAKATVPVRRPDVPTPDDVVDRPGCSAPRSRGWGPWPSSAYRPIDAQHDAGVLQPEEQVVQRRACWRPAWCRRPCPEDRRIRLDHPAVHHPRLPRPHPADGVGIDPSGEQPDAGVGRRLARADDDVLARRVLELSEGIHRDDPGVRSDSERWRRLRRDGRREVGAP